MTDYPLISVIIPAYNVERFITETLDSVVANHYPNLQIIVVDDGSSDDTAEKVRSHPASVTLIQQENQGLSVALNRGLAHADGEMIAFLDADDIWTPDKLKIQVALIKDADIVMGKMSLMINQQVEMFRASLSTALFRKTVFDRVGNFSEDLQFAMDHDLFFKAREAGFRIVKHEEVIHRHRRHEDNMSNDQSTGRHYEMIALKRSLDRRRQAGKMTVLRFDANLAHKDRSSDEASD